MHHDPFTRDEPVQDPCQYSNPNCKPVYVTHLRMWVSFERGACKQLVRLLSGLSAA